MDKIVNQQNIEDDLFVILDEVKKDVFLLTKNDLQTSEYLKEVMIDYKLNLYFLLQWIKSEYNPQNILYPASGSDKIPKTVFGEDYVIHTSLEDLEEEGRRYFDELGDAIKIVADNTSLPFDSEIFDLVLPLDSSFEIIGEQRDELLRVLKKDGLIVLVKNLFQEDNPKNRITHYYNSNILELIPLPREFQKKGESNTNFFVFKKIV